MPTNEPEGRLLDPETIFLCRPYRERDEDGKLTGRYAFEFFEIRIPERKLIPHGSVRQEMTGYLGWDVSPDGTRFALGAVSFDSHDVKKRRGLTMVWDRGDDVSEPDGVRWTPREPLPFGIDPVFSPDGKRLAVKTAGTGHRRPPADNSYFLDPNPLKFFRFLELD